MTVFLSVAVALFAGLMLTRVFKKLGFNFPDVTAYLIAGLIIGPCVAGILSREQLESMGVISDAALGFIAYEDS